MHLPPLPQLKIKNYIHGFQGFLIFLIWALTIAVFTKPGNTDGRSKYVFALVSLLSLLYAYLPAKEKITVLALYTGPDLLDSHANLRKNEKVCASLRVCHY